MFWHIRQFETVDVAISISDPIDIPGEMTLIMTRGEMPSSVQTLGISKLHDPDFNGSPILIEVICLFPHFKDYILAYVFRFVSIAQDLKADAEDQWSISFDQNSNAFMR